MTNQNETINDNIPEFNSESSELDNLFDSYLNVNPDDIPQQSLLAPGVYDLRVTKVIPKTSKSGNPYIQVVLVAIGFDAPPIFHTLFLFKKEDSNDDKNKALRKINMFCDACGALGSTLKNKLDDCVGKELTASVGIQTPNDPKYLPNNCIKALFAKKNAPVADNGMPF